MLQNNVHRCIGSRRLTLLDLSAVFDTDDHAILLCRLQTTYGITGTALVWFSSYLHERNQFNSILTAVWSTTRISPWSDIVLSVYGRKDV